MCIECGRLALGCRGKKINSVCLPLTMRKKINKTYKSSLKTFMICAMVPSIEHKDL